MEIEAINPSSPVPLSRIEETRSENPISYVYILRSIWETATIQTTRYGEKGHTSTTELKRDIRLKSKITAHYQEKIGNTAFYTALIGGVCTMLQFSPERPQVQNGFKWLGEQGAQGYNNMRSNYLMAQMGPVNQDLQMKQTALQQNMSKDAAGSMQQNLAEFLRTAQGMFEQAARTA